MYISGNFYLDYFSCIAPVVKTTEQKFCTSARKKDAEYLLLEQLFGQNRTFLDQLTFKILQELHSDILYVQSEVW